MTPVVALTHSEGRLEGLAAALGEAGFEVRHTPLIATEPRRDAATLERARALLAHPWLLITSRSTVEAWRALGLPWTSDRRDAADEAIPGPRIGAVGPKTAAALAEAGARIDLIADPATAHGLAEAFLRHPDARGPVGLPQGDRARSEVADALEGAGFDVRPAIVYDTVSQPWTAAGTAPAAVVLASPSALEALPASVARAARLVALGPTTADAIRARGYRAVTADDPDPASVVRAVRRTLAASEATQPTASPAQNPELDASAPEETA